MQAKYYAAISLPIGLDAKLSCQRIIFLIELKCVCGYPDNCPNGHNPERHNPEGHNPEWTQSRMDTIPNGHNPEWTQSRMDTIPNGHNPEWTQS